MKTKRDGFSKAFKPYTDAEVALILSNAPTEHNKKTIAKFLGRNGHAIGMVYVVAYRKKLFPGLYENRTGGIGPAILRVKKKLGIFI